MKIDWKLLDNGEIVIDEVDKLTKFENNTIYYEDEYGEEDLKLLCPKWYLKQAVDIVR